jgi:hypothetical protein
MRGGGGCRVFVLCLKRLHERCRGSLKSNTSGVLGLVGVILLVPVDWGGRCRQVGVVLGAGR